MPELQFRALGAAHDITFSIVGEQRVVVNGCGGVAVIQRHEGTDAQLLDGADVRSRPVLGVGDEPRRSQLAPKEGAA